MKIKLGDFKLEDKEKKEFMNLLSNLLDSGKISENQNVKMFEKEWANFIGTGYCTLVNSGTSALIAGFGALKHLKLIKEKSKVITSPLTYVAPSNAIVNSNLEPVYVDVDKETFNITPENVKILLENSNMDFSTILPIHLMGYPVKMDEINKIAKKYGLITFEDASQAHGTIYNNKKLGSMSDLSIFSFYMAHNIQAGELGAILTNNPDLNKTLKKIKANGRMCDCDICTRNIHCVKKNEDSDPRFKHEIIGYNFKTTEFPAILALQQLRKIDEIIQKRQENVKYLNEGLSKFSDKLQLPFYSKNVSYLTYPIVIKDKKINRQKLCMELENKGVETRPLFGCIPAQQPSFSYLKKEYQNKLPIAESLGRNAFYIGCHQYLNQEELDYIIKVFKEILT